MQIEYFEIFVQEHSQLSVRLQYVVCTVEPLYCLHVCVVVYLCVHDVGPEIPGLSRGWCCAWSALLCLWFMVGFSSEEGYGYTFMLTSTILLLSIRPPSIFVSFLLFGVTGSNSLRMCGIIYI